MMKNNNTQYETKNVSFPKKNNNNNFCSPKTHFSQKIRKEKKNTNNTSDLLKQLKKQGMSGCSKVTFRLFGLSLSTLNLLTNLSFLIICIYIFRNEQRQKN